jgi:hypothetical protein
VDSGFVAGFIRLDYKPQQVTITWDSFFNSTGISFFNLFCLALAVASVPLGPTGATLLHSPTKRPELQLELSSLSWNSNCLLTLELLLTVLLKSLFFSPVLWAPGSGLKCPRVDRSKEITDYITFEVFTAVTMKNAVFWDDFFTMCVGC